MFLSQKNIKRIAKFDGLQPQSALRRHKGNCGTRKVLGLLINRPKVSLTQIDMKYFIQWKKIFFLFITAKDILLQLDQQLRS